MSLHRQRWEKGTFRVLLVSGAEFTFTGRVRFSQDAEGFFDDYEIDSGEVFMHPHFGRVDAVLRVDTDEGSD